MSGLRGRRSSARVAREDSLRSRAWCRLAARYRRRRMGSALLVCLLLAAQFSSGVAEAGFSATTTAASSFAAAGSFETYPQAVVNDSPLFYHRFEEPPGAVTGADSSGNGRRVVFAPQNTTALPTAVWPLDEGSGTTSADLSGAVTPNTITRSGAAWTTGQSGAGLSFNGTSDYATSAATEVDTSADFSVAAWVYLGDITTSHTAVSQSGTAVSGFELGYDSALTAWVFRMRQSDSTGAAIDVTSGGTVTPNTWTHLTATFTGSTMTLYVNYFRVGTPATHSSVWNAGGLLLLGAGLSTTRNRFWNGRVDDVRTYATSLSTNSNLSATQGQELAFGITGGPSTSWQFDENTGSTVTDQSGATNTATLTNGVSWGTGANKKWSTSAGTFDGVNDYAIGRFSAVKTTAAFSVSAWVYLTDTAVSRIAVSQDGATSSRFALGYNKSADRWSFEMARTDTGSPTVDKATSGSAPTLGTWVYLVGVYNPASTGAELKLYVGGALTGSAAHSASWSATGSLVAGAAKDTSRARYFKGNIDDVRTFGWALAVTDISRLMGSDPTTNYAVGRASLGLAGALQGAQQGQQASTALGNSSVRAFYNPLIVNNPTHFTVECWYRTNVQVGRAIVSFGNVPSGNSSGGGTRRLFIDAGGNFGYGQNPSAFIVTNGVDYADGNWHHLAVTVDPTDGTTLYVDGTAVASAAYVAVATFAGYWRLNGDTWGGSANWGGGPGLAPFSDYNANSSIDEWAVYATALSPQQIARHYYANH